MINFMLDNDGVVTGEFFGVLFATEVCPRYLDGVVSPNLPFELGE